MAYVAKEFSYLLGMPGFSDTLLKNHFALYQGYVNNTNKIMELVAGMVKEGKESTPEFAELKRRLGWEFNGMRLHELYFANLGGDGNMSKAPKLEKKKREQFGSVETCAKDFIATAAMRGIGWVIMYQDIESGLLFNQWINEHDVGHPAGCNPLLVLDVFEHAFITDYGLKKADYFEAFFKNVKWDVVEKRLR
jgi:Fe-Mn family superoxide dismutase